MCAIIDGPSNISAAPIFAAKYFPHLCCSTVNAARTTHNAAFKKAKTKTHNQARQKSLITTNKQKKMAETSNTNLESPSEAKQFNVLRKQFGQGSGPMAKTFHEGTATSGCFGCVMPSLPKRNAEENTSWLTLLTTKASEMKTQANAMKNEIPPWRIIVAFFVPLISLVGLSVFVYHFTHHAHVESVATAPAITATKVVHKTSANDTWLDTYWPSKLLGPSNLSTAVVVGVSAVFTLIGLGYLGWKCMHHSTSTSDVVPARDHHEAAPLLPAHHHHIPHAHAVRHPRHGGALVHHAAGGDEYEKLRKLVSQEYGLA